MPRNRLNAAQVRAKIRAGIPGRWGDGNGLTLSVDKAGNAYWLYRWSSSDDQGKRHEHWLSLGKATAETGNLTDVRSETEKLYALRRQGIDPRQHRAQIKAAAAQRGRLTFSVAIDEHIHRSSRQRTDKQGRVVVRGWTPRYRKTVENAVARHLSPDFENRPIADISPPEWSRCWDRIEEDAPEVALRLRQQVSRMYDFHLERGECEANPIVRRPKPPAESVVHHAAYGNLQDIGQLLRDIGISKLGEPTKRALWLGAHLALRPSNLVNLRWSQFDFSGDRPTLTIARSELKTKIGSDFVVPLSKPVAAMLHSWIEADNMPPNELVAERYLFPSERRADSGGRRLPITIETLEKAMRVTLKRRNLMTVHGWRASFSTLAHEAVRTESGEQVPRFDSNIIEACLDHITARGNAVGRRYNRASHLAARATVMAWWSDSLLVAERGAEVLQLRRDEQ